MYPCRVLLLLCALYVSCSARPHAGGFGFTDGKPIYVVRESSREECLRAAEARCGGGFAVLAEGPTPRYRSGWADPAQREAENDYFVRVKCDNH